MFNKVLINKEVISVLFLGLISFTMSFPASAKSYKYPYSAFKDRDPFRPLVNERGEILIRVKRKLGNFLLQGILYAPRGSKVIINNEIFKQGDVVAGYKIKKIDAYKVTLEKGKRKFILKWGG